MNSLLITGGAGFIGVNAAKHFLEKGWSVTVLDNFSRRGTEINRAFLEDKYGDRVKIAAADIRKDQKMLQSVMEEHDGVLHLAAQVAVTTSVTNPREDFEINALGTMNILEAVRLSRRRPALLYASTNKVYGGLEDIGVVEGKKRYAFAGGLAGVSERQGLDFHSPYGCSKGAADQYVRDYARLFGLKTVVLRQSCIYGPHQLGVEDQGWVAWFLIAAMFGRPVQIYGNGKQVRDLLFVDDLVNLYERALQRIDDVSGEIFNIGGGSENTLSLLEFVEMLRDDLAFDLSFSFGTVRPGDQPIFVSDNGKALRALGWSPAVRVPEGIRRLAAWLTGHRSVLEKFYAVEAKVAK